MDSKSKRKASNYNELVGIQSYKGYIDGQDRALINKQGDGISNFVNNLYYFLFITPDFAEQSRFSYVLNNIEIARVRQLIPGEISMDKNTAFLFGKGYTPFVLLMIEGSDEGISESKINMSFQQMNNTVMTCFNFINPKTAGLSSRFLDNNLRILKCVLKITYIDGTDEEFPVQDNSILTVGRIYGIPYNGYAIFFEPSPPVYPFEFQLPIAADKLRKIKGIAINPL